MKKQLTIYYTSDTHGAIFPDMGGGSVLQCAREFVPDGDTLVLDGGDTIQGSPLATYLWQQGDFTKVIPAAFAEAGYQYFALGNHDFNNGYPGLAQFLGGMQARCVTANVTDSTGRLPILPWVVHTTESGLRVGLTGVVTDYVNLWEAAENLEHLRVTDPFAAAQEALAALHPLCDITICIYHGGYEEDLETGVRLLDNRENVGCRICRELDFDLLLTAHQHAETAGRLLHGTYTLQLPPNALKYARLTATQTPTGWQFASQLRTPAPMQEADSPLLVSLAPLREQFVRWMQSPAGSLAAAIPADSKLDCALHGTAVADLCNAAQLWLTDAEISCTGLANQPAGLPQQLTMGDLCSAYRFANTVTVLQVTAEALLQALERCASYLDIEDGQPAVSQRFLRPKEEHYNYDFFAGVQYRAELRSPVGQRVRDVRVNGQPLQPGRRYSLALSNYRATGTGGYTGYASCPVVKTWPEDIRDVIIRYLTAHPAQALPRCHGVEWDCR